LRPRRLARGASLLTTTPAARGRRRADSVARLPDGVLACPRCARPLHRRGDVLRCSRGHRYQPQDGIYDLWPDAVPVPSLDWFATPYGLLYDAGIKERWLARLGGRIGWGTDIDRMFRMMDEGVKNRPGEVVLDVPAGGAPPLRAAAGRLLGSYVGVDLSLEMLRRAEAERRSEGLDRAVLVRGDINHLPVTTASVDRALCFNGLHVLPDKAAALAELHRVLKPGGLLHGNVVVRDDSPAAILRRPWFSRSWLFFHPADPDELMRLALAAGFIRWDQHREGSMLYFEAERGRA
jgi:SAM-dependent methyltransferase